MQTVAEKILSVSEALGGIERLSFQMSIASLPHAKRMHAIELLGAKVAPAVREHSRAVAAKEQAPEPPASVWDKQPRWEQVHVPVLLIYGEQDRNTPVAPSLAGITQALQKAGNAGYTPIIIPGAAHNLTIQWHTGQPFFWWYGAPGYSNLLVAWVKLRFPEK
jgi:pimeloyl-ACP methyl ester carboxylesterase